MRPTGFLLVFLLLDLAAPAQHWQRLEDDDAQAAREQWFYSQRAYPRGSIPPGARLNALRRQHQIDTAARRQHQAAPANQAISHALTMDSVNWTAIGPRPTGGGSNSVTSGRVIAIAIDPRDNNVVYIGAAEGGVWKTTDGGQTWTPLTDNQPSLANGAIAIDPNHPDTVYVGTGEEDFAYDSYYGAGILKSTDAGATWTDIVGPFLRDSIGAIAVDPSDSKVLLCTSRKGVWRSADAGQTWTPTLSATAGISVVFDPTNGSSAYATLGYPYTGGDPNNGVYHSTDGGLTWKRANGSGTTALPTANVGRIEIAMAPSSPSTLYAQIEDAGDSTFGRLLGIYKTIDGGATWNQLPVANLSLWGNQLWYSNTIRVSPSDPNVVWAGALEAYRSLDGGNTWSELPYNGTNNTFIHVDFHALAFTPDGSKLYLGNDGGVWSTTDISGRNVNWTELNDTLDITQFYPGMSVDPTNPLIALAGAQDNATQRYSGDMKWSSVACGDGAYTVIDPTYPAIAYTTCGTVSGAAIGRTLNVSGSSPWIQTFYGIDPNDRVPFIGPLVMDPSNPQTLYYGTYRLWQTRDGAGRWNAISPDLSGGHQAGTVRAIAVAPSDSNTVYAATDNGRVQVTRNAGDGAGASWTDVSADLPSRTATRVAVDPLDPATAYSAFSGFSGPGQGHIFKTTNAGSSWTDISGNLPDVPVNDSVIDPDLPGTIYIGTDIGVLVSTDNGSTWSTLGNGLPNVVVQSLVLDRHSRVRRAATHGRGAWEILAPLSAPSLQPAIGTLSPASANPGDPAFSLNVTGSNFTASTVIRWNGQSRSTGFVDSSHVVAQIPASDVAAVGRASVTAFNTGSGGGASNAVPFTIGGAPQATSQSVVSAANPLGGNALAPSSIATLYGVNLAGQTATADANPPLPITLGGSTLFVGTRAVPLFYVSQGQISFQVPTLPPGNQILTITQGVQSTNILIQLTPYAPAIFTTNQQGSGQAAVLIANTASIAAPVGAFPGSRPAHTGEYISIYCTGLGSVTNQPPDGSPAPATPLAATPVKPVVTIGGVAATVIFSGLAPGYVGLYQVNVQVPGNAPTGANVPIAMKMGTVISNTAGIAVDPAQ